MTNTIRSLSRRDLFRLSLAGTLTTSPAWFEPLRARAEAMEAAGRKPAKQCVLLWLGGGPSQAHSFDPKPGEHVQLVKTGVPGLQFSEYLPRLAERMRHLVLVKTMNHGNFGHGDAVIWSQTGYKTRDGGLDHPSLGARVAHAFQKQEAELPHYVVVDPMQAEGAYSMGAGYLGPQFAPLKVNIGQAIPDLQPTAGLTPADLAARTPVLEKMNKAFLAHNHSSVAAGQQSSLEQALKIMQTPKTKAFDLDREPEKVQERYGKGRMGRACLLARRLVEADVPFVAAHIKDGKGNGWDTHMDAPNRNKELFQDLDQCFSALIDDLECRGRLDSTLILCMGEFGRSRNGVEHNNKMWTAVLAGGGLKTGQSIGHTGDDGKTLTEYRPVKPADLFATVLKALGIDHTQDYTVRGGRPVGIVAKDAKPIEEVF